MENNFKYVGNYIPLHDIEQKVRGKVKYTNDMVLPGMLYAKLLLSSVAHGNIKNIDTSKAEALPGVKAVFTYKNSPDTLYNSHKWIDGLEVIKDERLFSDKARFNGDRIAAVVAVDRQTAERAVRLIEVEYEELPPVINPYDALNDNSPKVHNGSNVVFEKEMKCGNFEEGFKDAYLIVEDKVETPKVHHAAMETHTCIADVDSYGQITVWSPCQDVFQVQLLISEILNIPQNRIRVIKTTMGGSFGGKGHPILEPVCAFLALKLRKPVKLIMDRTDTILSTRTRTKTIGRVKTAVDRDGNILARDIDTLVDVGAYFTNGDAVAVAMGKKSFKLYRVKNQRFKTTCVYTNTPIGGAARGYGSPQIHAITEVNLNNVARKLKMDPVEFRLKNLVHPYDDDPIGGPNLGNARIRDCLIRGAEAFNWKEKYNRPKESGRYVRGFGVACCAHGDGYFGAYPDFITMSLRIAGDGSAILKASLHDMGCGTITSITQIVAETLSMDINKIFVPEADTLISPFDSAGTQASRVTYVCGGAAEKAARTLMEKMINYGADIFGCDASDVVMEDGYMWSKKDEKNKLSYGDAATIIQKKYSDEAGCTITHKSPGNPASYGVNFAEVEVDTITGRVRVIEILSVHDVGRAINRGFVEGQIHGAIQMGIGMALSEEITFDARGRAVSNRFSRYHVLNAPDMPEVKVLLVEEGEGGGPYGAKSIGEIATVPTAPAIINAINNALDINIDILPATPERIVEKIKLKNKK